MAKKILKKFNVLFWNFNLDKLEHYDVLPYFRRCFEERSKEFKRFSKTKKYQKLSEEAKAEWLKYHFVPKTFEEFKKFVESESRYMFWARCEYEMIVHGWPVKKDDYKLDIHEQIMMNIDIVAEILMNELNKDPKK